MAVVTGTNSGEILNGTNNNDTVKGLKGDDTLFGMDGDDILDGGDGNDTIDSGIGDDILLGGIGLDTLVGGTGNNRLDGGRGADDMRGGDGDDTYVVDDANDLVTDTSGTDLVEASRSYVLGADIENLTLFGNAKSGTGNALNNTITGNKGANQLFGLGGDDTIDGGLGADSMAGGDGDDFYIVDGKGDKVFELAGEGVNDQILAFCTYTLPAEVENLALGTTIGKFNAIGNALSNVLTGNPADNTLDGMGGADLMFGDDGNDVYIADDVNDTALDTTGTDEVRASVTYSLLATTVGVENLTLTGTLNIDGTGTNGDNTITGNSGINILNGLDGDDTLNGGAGADLMVGGKGDDTYVVDNAADAITEVAGEGTQDAVLASVSYDMGLNAAEVEILTLTGKAAINGTGNAGDNTITGNAGANTLSGGIGADTISGGGGTDTLLGGTGDDVYIVNVLKGLTIIENPGEGVDTVQAGVTFTLGAELDNLLLTGVGNIDGTGNALVNTLTGNAGNNTLDGMGGADSLIGGGGNDVFVTDNAGDEVDATGGTGTIRSSVSWDLTVNTTGVNDLVLTGVAAINGTGNAAANTITGNTAVNVLTGAAGDDVLFADAFDILDGGGDSDTAAIDFTSAVTNGNWTSIENIWLQGKAMINATGDGGNNTLIGNSAVNTLDGGLGDDTYGITKGDVIVDAGGIDTVMAGFTYTLIAGMENLILTGTAKINGTGNAADNTLIGNAGINTLDGLGGINTLDGGAGNDVLIVNLATDVVLDSSGASDTVRSSVTFSLVGTGAEHLVLTGAGNIDGTGDGGANSLTGNAGNNILDGGAGADVMAGGKGNDTFLFDSADDRATDSGGIDTVIATDVDATLGDGIENLTLVSVLNMDLDGTGNKLNNIIFGTDGNNTLDGMGGNDTLLGGLGDDTYVVDRQTDVVFENIGEGSDTIISNAPNFIMGHDVEILQLGVETALRATGNALDNTMTGNGANNVLHGADGADTIDGAAGDDTLYGELGDDVLTGNGGLDVLYGGGGADTFVFLGATAFDGNIDNIRDYNRSELDILDVSDILAGTTYIDGVSDPNDYVQYATNTRELLIDTSGSAGANGWVPICVINPRDPDDIVLVKFA